MSENKDKCIIITGMHHSGTDILAGCLQLSGVKTVGDFAPLDPQAVQTSQELQDISLVHDLLMQDLGVSWDRIGPLPQGWESSEPARSAGEHLHEIIKDNLAGSGVFAISDPRIGRLIPLWLNLASNLDLDLHFVLAMRRPWDVAAQLSSHNGLDRHKAHLLWMVHNQEAFLNSHKHPRSLVIYEQLLSNPLSVLSGLGQDISLDFSREGYQGRSTILSHMRKFMVGAGKKQPSEVPDEFKDYQWLYEQIYAHSSGKSLAAGIAQGRDKDQLPAAGNLPLPFNPLDDNQPVESSQAGHVKGLVNHVLQVIGRFEKGEQEHRDMLQETLQKALMPGEAFIARVILPCDDREDPVQQKTRAQPLVAGQWRRITVPVPEPRILRRKSLQLSLLSKPGLAAVAGISLTHDLSGEIVWQADAQSGFDRLDLEGQALYLNNDPDKPSAQEMRILVTGNDARIVLPPLPDLPDAPLCFQVWIKADRDLSALHDYWQERINQQEQYAARIAALEEKTAGLEKEKKQAEQDLKETQTELNHKKTQQEKEIRDLQEKLARQEKLTQEYFSEMTRLDQELEQEKTELQQKLTKNTQTELESKISALEKEKAQLTQKTADLEKQSKAQADKAAALDKEKSDLQQKLTSLEKAKSQAEENLKNTQNELKKQEELCREYFTEMSKLEEQLSNQPSQAGQEQISRLESKLRQKELALSREKNRARQEKEALISKLDKLQKRYEAKVNFFTKRAIKRKKKKLFEDIKASGFFDAQYYLEQNPDVKQSGMDPLTHYMNHGWKEGRNPSAKFNTNKYLEQNPDVAMDYINPLEHYVLYGQHEDRPDPKGD